MTFAFHVENRYASGKAKRPRGPRPSLAILRGSSGSSSPQIDLQTRALGYYLQCHIQTLPDVPSAAGEGTLSGSVAAWGRSGKTCEIVDLALSSLALAVFSRTHRHSQAAVEAASRYSRLLHMARGRIAQVGSTDVSEERDFEAYLVAVSLMARYESSVYGSPTEFNSLDRCSTSPPSFSHYDGATAILKLWHDSLGPTRPTTPIVKNTRRGLIKLLMLRRLPLPAWMLDGAQFGEAEHDLERDRIIARIVNLNAAVSAPSTHQPDHGHDTDDLQMIDDLETEARSLDQALETRAAHFPPEWSYQQQKTQPRAREPGAPDPSYSPATQYTFSQTSHAAIWSQHFAYRLLLSSIQLSLLAQRRPRPDPFLGSAQYDAQVEHTIQSQRMADSLAASLPSCWDHQMPTTAAAAVSDARNRASPSQASLAIWPLSIACSITEDGIVDGKQQRWFREQLAWLGKVTGAGILERHAALGL